MSGLKGKVGIVTGAGGGIGQVIAERLANDGMKLMIADVVGDHVDARLDALGGESIGHVGDLGKEAVVREMVAKTVERFGTTTCSSTTRAAA